MRYYPIRPSFKDLIGSRAFRVDPRRWHGEKHITFRDARNRESSSGQDLRDAKIFVGESADGISLSEGVGTPQFHPDRLDGPAFSTTARFIESQINRSCPPDPSFGRDLDQRILYRLNGAQTAQLLFHLRSVITALHAGESSRQLSRMDVISLEV
jgi:hypothetical protein